MASVFVGLSHLSSLSRCRHHYGILFRVDIVDASTDAVVGTTILTAHGLLQNQRDLLVAQHGGSSVLQAIKGPLRWRGKRRWKLELRSGAKDGFRGVFTASQSESERALDDAGATERPGKSFNACCVH